MMYLKHGRKVKSHQQVFDQHDDFVGLLKFLCVNLVMFDRSVLSILFDQ